MLILSIFIFYSSIISTNLESKINNYIVAKVGNLLITSVDIENEIITNLIINKQEISQENINNNKDYAVKNLINKLIKRNEINKYQIKNYNEADLEKYIKGVAKNINTNSNGLKNIFKESNVNYKIFVERHKTELLWNTLIFQLYNNQTNINIVDVNNEIEKRKKDISDEEFKKVKENILNKKKKEKFNLFSRSHFLNLENTININFQ